MQATLELTGTGDHLFHSPRRFTAEPGGSPRQGQTATGLNATLSGPCTETETNPIDDEERLREQRARRTLAKHNFKLNKMPARHWRRAWTGPGYQILEGNYAHGAEVREYGMALEEVEDWIEAKLS